MSPVAPLGCSVAVGHPHGCASDIRDVYVLPSPVAPADEFPEQLDSGITGPPVFLGADALPTGPKRVEVLRDVVTMRGAPVTAAERL